MYSKIPICSCHSDATFMVDRALKTQLYEPFVREWNCSGGNTCTPRKDNFQSPTYWSVSVETTSSWDDRQRSASSSDRPSNTPSPDRSKSAYLPCASTSSVQQPRRTLQHPLPRPLQVGIPAVCINVISSTTAKDPQPKLNVKV